MHCIPQSGNRVQWTLFLACFPLLFHRDPNPWNDITQIESGVSLLHQSRLKGSSCPEFVSMVILIPIRLTIKIKHHSIHSFFWLILTCHNTLHLFTHSLTNEHRNGLFCQFIMQQWTQIFKFCISLNFYFSCVCIQQNYFVTRCPG